MVEKAKKGKLDALVTRARAQKSASLARKKARAEELLALIGRRKTRLLEDFYDVGEALRELRDGRLFEALGCASFEQMLAQHDVMGATQAKKLVALVSSVPREQALRLGQEKAYALVAYTAATPQPDDAGALAKTDAKVGKKRLSQASLRDIERATKDARAKVAAQRPKTAAQRASEKEARAARAAVSAFLKKHGARGAIETTEGAVLVRFRYDQALALAR